MNDVSEKVQIISAIVSLLGTTFAGVLTYLMARLKSDQEARGVEASTKVKEIQQALARVEANRTNLAVVRAIIETHGNCLVDITRDTAARLAAHPDPAEFPAAMLHHAESMIANTKATVAKLAALDDAERGMSDGD